MGEATARSGVLVTGGAGGLGVAVVERLVADGFRVTVPIRDVGDADRLPDSPLVRGVTADLREEDSVAGVVAAAGTPDEPLSAIVNLVGGFLQAGRAHETSDADLRGQIELNLGILHRVCRIAIPRLLEAGGGSIVTVSSRAAEEPFTGVSAYAAAKAAVAAYTKALAVEYGADGIRANAIVPGVIDTPANREAMPGSDRANWVPPALIADVIGFLVSPASAATNGAVLPVAGTG